MLEVIITGIALALLASLCWAVSAVFVRLSLNDLRSSTTTIISLISGIVATMTLSLILFWDPVFDLSIQTFKWLILAGILTVPFGRFLNFSSGQRLGISRALPIIGIAPLFAASFAVLFLGEHVTIPLLAGTISIISGVALIVSSK